MADASAARLLRAAQADITIDNTAAIRDVARAERAETMRTQIARAAASGGDREVVSHATAPGTRAGDDEYGHLDRRRLAESVVNDGLRASAQAARAAASTSIIRQAAAGQMSVRDAITASQADDVDRLAERVAAPLPAGERAGP